jgi:hypothetical protein
VCAKRTADLNFHTITFGRVKICASRDNEILITRAYIGSPAKHLESELWRTQAAIQEVPHIKMKETCFGLMSGGRKYFEASSSIIYLSPDLCSFLIAFSCLFQVYL